MVAEFYDSSAFTKLFISEHGSSFVRSRYVAADIRVVSRLAQTEVLSAIARLNREGALTDTHADSARSALRTQVSSCQVIHSDESVNAAAEVLIEQHTLRTLDALQLASALAMSQRQQTYFVAADRRLLIAAKTVGLDLVDANQHP